MNFLGVRSHGAVSRRVDAARRSRGRCGAAHWQPVRSPSVRCSRSSGAPTCAAFAFDAGSQWPELRCSQWQYRRAVGRGSPSVGRGRFRSPSATGSRCAAPRFAFDWTPTAQPVQPTCAAFDAGQPELRCADVRPRSPSMLAAVAGAPVQPVQPLGWPWPVRSHWQPCAAPRLAVAVFGVLAHGFRKRASQSVLDALCAMLAASGRGRCSRAAPRFAFDWTPTAQPVRRLRCWQPELRCSPLAAVRSPSVRCSRSSGAPTCAAFAFDAGSRGRSSGAAVQPLGWPWPVQPLAAVRSPSVCVRLDANRAAGAADVRRLRCWQPELRCADVRRVRLRCWQPVAGAPVQPRSPSVGRGRFRSPSAWLSQTRFSERSRRLVRDAGCQWPWPVQPCSPSVGRGRFAFDAGSRSSGAPTCAAFAAQWPWPVRSRAAPRFAVWLAALLDEPAKETAWRYA